LTFFASSFFYFFGQQLIRKLWNKRSNMEVASNHHRDSSLSSFGTLHSMDMDSYVDDDGATEPPAENHSVLCINRKRLGAEMAIIAATSPEIKALNLPSTPSFPPGLNYHHRRSDSNGTFSSCSSISISSNWSRPNKGTLTPLLASMDDVERSSSFLNQSDPQDMHAFCGGTDDMVRSFENRDLDTSMDDAKVLVTISYDNKNIHPNLLPSKNNYNRKKPRASHHRPSKYSKCPLPRKSLHRRASYDSLPSPAEIGQSSSPRVVRRATCGAFPFFPSDMDTKKEVRRHRPAHHQTSSMRMVPKSMQLSTGFR
jgi:hypothetical protein